MFSVLIRYKVSRREVLISAETVEFIPPESPDNKVEVLRDMPGLLVNCGVEGEKGCHLAMTPDDDPDFRDVFVMNAQGQTVARYML